ncbi:hypothetical protein NODU109028_10995 [Nocardioides dubius]|uniref:Uncharacterized protein n=1 Tax=Nocardioides dubius TaxID=317019 RepID=A0ABN1TU66_9ACTN
MRVLILTTRPKLSARTVRSWRSELGVAKGDLRLVAMPASFAGRPMPAASVILLPRSRRWGALPWSAAVTSGREAHILGGRRIPRALEARIGRAFDDWRSRKPRELDPDLVSARFAAQCATLPQIARQFSRADIVIALDPGACRAAWQMAQQAETPQVLFGLAAGSQAVAEARQRGGLGQ